jgi:ATP-dependent helicase/DNAse subunit B
LADSLLITGPPASGKSRIAQERFLAASDSILLTPTATMAEHVRNELARHGFPVRPNRILTLAGFLEQRVGRPASPAMLDLAIQEALDELRPARFLDVARYPGFRHSLANLIEEASANVVPRDLALVFQYVERSLARRGTALRRDHLAAVSANPQNLPRRIVFDGFFSFAPGECEFLESLARRAELFVTLPVWAGAEPALGRLLRAGFLEEQCRGVQRQAETGAFCAPTLEREMEEIAGRILSEAAGGRSFREIAIVLRSREPYGPALQTTLARFGIPARFYFADALIEHPAIEYLSRVVQAALREWDQASLLSALRMPVSGFGTTIEGDAFDFALREKLPAKGLPGGAPATFNRLEWMRERFDQQEWADRLKTLRSLIPVNLEDIETARSVDAALRAFEKVLDETAALLSERSAIPLAEFWNQVETGLRLEPLRHVDRRRNVVHVMDVFEARQWELPIVFVCGMVERHFPLYHREDALLGDAARARAGLKTSAESQRDERFLFDIATSRATERTVLSYSRFDGKGEETLRSFFLQNTEPERCETQIRPGASRPVRLSAPAPIREDASLARLGELHKKLAATSIETFLQCPFQFFASKTLKLAPRPAAPRDRLDVRLQGSILHRALAEFARAPLLGIAILDGVFFDECRRANIPLTYRTEAVRLELLRNFEAFTSDARVALGWATSTEEKISFTLNPILTITGRIDRLDVGPRNQALVIDYKYSAGGKIRERVNENDNGNLVQGGLYLAATQRALGLEPAGMLYCGLRKEVVWDGWHVAIAGLERVGESRTRDGLQELIDAAIGKASQTFEAIVSGEIRARPADEKKCAWCDFRDACRVESMALVRSAGTP